MEIAKILRKLREDRKLSKQAVADAIGMQRTSYLRYERDDGDLRTPRIEQLIALADFYGVSLDYLVGRSDDPRRLP